MTEKGYQGIKFEFVNDSLEAPNNPRINELIYWCNEFHGRSLTPVIDGYAAGNLSFRIEECKIPFIITTSGISSKAKLTNEHFATVSYFDVFDQIYHGGCVKERKPSSETPFHLEIYEYRLDVNAIFHGHCKEILDNARRLKIPKTSREEAYGTSDLARTILEVLYKYDDINFLIIKGHGFVSLGRTMDEAGKLALEMYEKCL